MAEEKESGTELIPRDDLAEQRTILANERTLLSYLRTALALLAAGGAVLHLFAGQRLASIGWLLLPLGAITFALGVARYRTVRRNINAIMRRARSNAGGIARSPQPVQRIPPALGDRKIRAGSAPQPEADPPAGKARQNRNS